MARFSIRQVMVVTAYFATVAAVAFRPQTPIGTLPPWIVAVAVFSLPFFAFFVLVGQRHHWIRLSKAFGSAIGGMALGILLFESPLPGAIAGLIAGGVLGRTKSLSDNNRRWVMLLYCLVVACILFTSVGLTWRHHLAKCVIRRSGGRVNWSPQSHQVFGHRTTTVANALGPYLVASNTYVSFQDSESRGVLFEEADFKFLLPHLKSVHGLDHVTVRCRNFGDEEAEQLAALTSLTHLGLIDTKVTSKGIHSFSNLTELTWLNLHGSSVTDDVVEPVMKLAALRFLGLGGTQITDDGIRGLSRLALLEVVIVPRMGVTPGAVSELEKSVRNVLQGD